MTSEANTVRVDISGDHLKSMQVVNITRTITADEALYTFDKMICLFIKSTLYFKV